MLARPLTALIGLLAATLGTAAEPATDTSACTWISSISDWHELDRSNLIVWVSRNEPYHLELATPLLDLDGARSIGFVDRDQDGRLCGYGMDEVVVPNSSPFGRSTIVAMTRLDESGLAALAEKFKLKLDEPADKKAIRGRKPTAR